LFYVDNSNKGFFKAAIQAHEEMQNEESYYKANKPTVEIENAIGLGADDTLVMKSCRNKVFPLLYMSIDDKDVVALPNDVVAMLLVMLLMLLLLLCCCCCC